MYNPFDDLEEARRLKREKEEKELAAKLSHEKRERLSKVLQQYDQMVSTVLKQLNGALFANRGVYKTYGYHLDPDTSPPRWFIGRQTTNMANMEVNDEDLTIIPDFNDNQQIILKCRSKIYGTIDGKNTVICSPSEKELIQALKDLCQKNLV